MFVGGVAMVIPNGNSVLPHDVKRLAGPVLGHRLIIGAQGRLDGRAGAELIHDLLRRVPAPVEDESPIER